MGLRLVCDGCEQPLDEREAATFGRLESVSYCAQCSEIWKAYLERERTERQNFVMEFEEFRRKAHATLRESGMKRLPDE